QEHQGLGGGLGRRPLDRARGGHARSTHDGDRPLPLRALRLAAGRQLCDEGRSGAAQSVRRPRRQEGLRQLATSTLNPLREGLRLSRIPEPSTIVIFGGSGDLAQRKLIPALYNLALQRLLPATFSIVGTSRKPLTHEQYREELHTAVAQYSRTKPLNEEVWRSFAEHLHFVATADDAGYEELRRTLDQLDFALGTHANRTVEPTGNRQYVDHVQITVAETIGVEERAGYYEQAGAMRDIVQNHLLQLLALVSMEPPAAFDDKAVRDEKVKVLRALRRMTGDDLAMNAVRGQYTRGFIEGVPVPGYREERGVAPDSRTET